MIQRIQTIYLLVATIAMALISFKVPVWTLNEQLFMAQDDTKMFILTISAFLFPLISIFLYKWRMVQIRLNRLAIVLGWVISIRLFSVHYYTGNEMSSYSVVLLLVYFVSLVLAYKAIKKDEDLVRSVDRIR